MNKIKKNDIIKVGKYKYVVYRFSKSNVELLPIDEMLDGESKPSFVPKMVINKNMINCFEKIDNLELLFLVNQQNPLIKEILHNYFEREEG